MSKLTYQDKVKLYDKPSIPEINKVTDANINNIKYAVNESTNYNAVTEDSAGKLKCNLTGALASGDIVPVSIPTLANTSATMQLSIDNGANYYYIKQMSDDAVFNDYSNTEISASKCTLYFDGTQFILDKSKFGGKVINNLNTIVRNGDYTAFETAIGVPNSTYSWFVNHNNSNAGALYATQRAVAYSTDLIVYERTKVNGTWGNWVNKDIYSTTETDTGEIWIDGKHIFRKVIPIATINASTTSTIISTGITNVNIVKDINLMCAFNNIDNNIIYYKIWNINELSFNKSNANIQVTFTSSATFNNCFAIIEYTKTS